MIIDPTTNAATSEDVRLYDAGNYGSDTKLAVGKFPNTSQYKARTLINFNLSGIPSTAIVLRATMNLKYYEAVNFGGGAWVDRWVQAHQMLVSWNEAQATKDNRLTGTAWNATYGKIGGTVPPADDANGQFESTTLFWQNETLPVWKSWELTALTQKWLNGTASNYGVVLWATNEDTDGYTSRFHSSEATNSSDRPYVEVVYSTEATTRTVYFLKDHLGSLRATVLDSVGAPVIGYDDYDPWGYPLALRTKAIPNAYLQGASKNKFTGNEFDDDFGINWGYHIDRFYDHQVGRWWVADPVQQESLSPYVYGANNPLIIVDPFGADTMYVDWPNGKRTAQYIPDIVTINNRPPKIPYYPTAEASTQAIDEPLIGEDAVAGAAKAGVKIGAGALGAVIIKNAIKPRGLWRLTEQGASRIVRHPKFGKFYKSISDGTWWVVDRAKHGGSAFKVFKEEGGRLKWIADADEFGNYIENKHKSAVGLIINMKDLEFVK